MARRRLLYIGGWGRSGSSVLANVLGSHARIASLGEVRYVWDRGVLEDKRCGCGEPFSACAFWQRVLETAQVGADAKFAAAQANAVGSAAINRQLRAMLTSGIDGYAGEHADALAALQRVYVAAAEVAGADAVVDASKTPPYAINLRGLEGFDLHFIHLVRDPRAVAFSWSRKVQSLEAKGELLPRYTAFRSSLYWSGLNALSTWFRERAGWSYLVVRYEDFCRSPRATIDGILAHCAIASDGIRWYGERELEVVPQHSISGNPSRFSVGRVTIALDDEWLTAMPVGQRRLVSVLNAPIAVRFGYPLSLRGQKGVV